MPSTLAAIVIAFIVAGLVVRIAHFLIHRLLGALDIVGKENRAAVYARAKQLIRTLTILAFGLAAVASGSLTLSRFGVSEPRFNLRSVGEWAITHGINLVVIATGAFVAIRVANLAIDHLQYKLA